MSKFIISGFADEISSVVTEQFEHLNSLGIEYFEPRGIDGTNIADLSDEQLSVLKEKMAKYGIKVSSIGSPIGKIKITDDFDEHLKKLDRVITIAKELGSKYIRIFSFYVEDGEQEKYRDEVIRRMKEMTALAEKRDIILLHENEKGIYGDIAVRCLDVLKEVNSPNLRAVFDPANFIQCGQATYPEAFEMLDDYVVYMHIKDAMSTGKVVPAGYGDGEFKKIINHLKEKNYEGFLSLEPHLGSFEGLENLEEDDTMTKLAASTPGKFTLAYEKLKELL